jgi:hypothetical protein
MTDAELLAMWNACNNKDTRARRNARKTAATEHDLQVACVRLFRYKYREYDESLFAIPNGGKRNPKEAARLKAEGVLAGVPDLFLAVPKGTWHGLFMELKNGKSNNLTENQKRVMYKMRMRGYRAEVIRSLEDFEKIIEEYLVKS